MTNDELNEIADAKFLDLIEGRPIVIFVDDFETYDRTLLFAKLAAKFASYAGDERNY